MDHLNECPWGLGALFLKVANCHFTSSSAPWFFLYPTCNTNEFDFSFKYFT